MLGGLEMGMKGTGGHEGGNGHLGYTGIGAETVGIWGIGGICRGGTGGRRVGVGIWGAWVGLNPGRVFGGRGVCIGDGREGEMGVQGWGHGWG